ELRLSRLRLSQLRLVRAAFPLIAGIFLLRALWLRLLRAWRQHRWPRLQHRVLLRPDAEHHPEKLFRPFVEDDASNSINPKSCRLFGQDDASEKVARRLRTTLSRPPNGTRDTGGVA